jgi:hypothetical protein
MLQKAKLFDDMRLNRETLIESTLAKVIKKMFSLYKKGGYKNECFKLIADRNYRVTFYENENEVAIYLCEPEPVRIATITNSGTITHGKLQHYNLVVITEISNGFENTFTG